MAQISVNARKCVQPVTNKK